MPSRARPLVRRAPLRAKAPLPRKAILSRATGPKRKRPKPLRSRLRDASDDLWSKLVRAHSPVCELRLSPACRGRSEHACHLISRSRWRTRWLLRNGAAGCCVCHGYGHAYKAAWEAFCRTRLGNEEWEALLLLSKDRPQTTEELREVLARLRALWRNAS
jgi:hypothetical protein